METLNYIGAQETLHPGLGFKELRQLAMPHIVSSQTRPGLGPQEMETAGDNSHRAHRELPGQSSAGRRLRTSSSQSRMTTMGNRR